MQQSNDRLATSEYWEGFWKDVETKIRFDPEHDNFRDLHHLFLNTLPVDGSRTMLEIGACPGRFLWYFDHFFRYQVTGVDYARDACEKAQAALDEANVKASIMCADLLEFANRDDRLLFDIVASFGFVEHFRDLTGVIEAHLKLLAHNGYLIIIVPNHSGIYGEIMKRVDLRAYDTHTLISLSDITASLSDTGCPGEILAAGYFGRLGFGATGIYEHAHKAGRVPYLLARTPGWLLERMGRRLPNTKTLSPQIAVVFRKS